MFYLNALTGEDVTEASAESGVLLQGKDVVAGPLVEAYLLQHEGNKFIVLLDEYLQVCCSPCFLSQNLTPHVVTFRSISSRKHRKLNRHSTPLLPPYISHSAQAPQVPADLVDTRFRSKKSSPESTSLTRFGLQTFLQMRIFVRSSPVPRSP